MKCGAYVNPGFQFVDQNQAMKCNLCGEVNKLNGNKYIYCAGQKTLVELTNGMYEFEVGGRYVY